jgi:phytoene synthase
MNTAHEYCRNKVAQSGSSFYYSFRFLSAPQQMAMHALYAFCREVDDIVDECSENQVALQKLSWWKTELDHIYTGNPQHPVGKALKQVLETYPLPKILFEEILQGMHMDLNYQGYQTFSDLEVYCHCVASTVGLLSAQIFGFTAGSTKDFAKNLGIAFQLVNIIRDVGEDAKRNRIYIPQDELTRFAVTAQDILQKNYTDNFVLLMQFQAKRAKDYYRKALNSLHPDDKINQKSALIMSEIYFTLLQEIEKMKFKVLDQRVSLTPIRKLWIALKTDRKIKKNRPILVEA